MGDNLLEARVRARLDALRRDGLLRSLRTPAGIDLSSNDYLNLAAHPLIVSRFADAAAREGCGSTGSRLLRGHRDAFAQVERRFASFKGTEASLYFATGYQANLAVMTTFAEAGDQVFSDAHNHASLIDGMRLARARTAIFAHNDPGDLRRALDDAPSSAIRFVVVESLFSMDGDEAPLREYAAICEAHGAELIVDEAHAVGVCGGRGRGLIEASQIDGQVFLSINTAGKALGVSGAFVAGPAWAIELLVQRARPFVFSTAPPPALADALDASLSLVDEEPDRRERVRQRAAYLAQRLAANGIDLARAPSHIIPIVIGGNDRAVAVASALQSDGFDVRAIRPPTVPAGTARLRVSINAGLSEADLNRFAACLREQLDATGGPVPAQVHARS